MPLPYDLDIDFPDENSNEFSDEAVKEDVRDFFTNPDHFLYQKWGEKANHRRMEDIYHKKQIQVLFERRDYWHWVTDRAITTLLEEGFLKEVRTDNTIFVMRSDVRYYKQKIKERMKLISRYSDPYISRGYGVYAEDLFRMTLEIEGFHTLSKNTNEYDNSIWVETDHNLDFIIEKEEIVYGAEVKNTLDYMEKEEFNIKLEMCEYFGIIPLWILRNAPGLQFMAMKLRGGFIMRFGTQFYPPGFRSLVRDIWNIMRLPVNVWRSIPEKIINVFLNFHSQQE